MDDHHSADGVAMPAVLIGTDISTAAGAGDDPVRAALDAEQWGYDFVSASDHPAGSSPTYETVTMLTWIAARTSRISIATRVLGMPFRRPAMVAKTAESLQRLAGGRVILGLGAGYSDAEIVALGEPVASTRDKVAGLADALTIIRRVWAEASVTYRGRVHSVTDLTVQPKPADSIPIWLGAFGPRMLDITGRFADGWIPSFGFLPPADVPDRLQRIRDAAHAAGRPPDAVRAVYNVPVRIGRSVLHRGQAVSGSVADVVEKFAGFVELGFSGFNLMPAPGHATVVGEELLPELRRTLS
jgi:alkanesulfonate monooxygenase SsuD/methylene tetrahydromethanopterin reductase-like flavin-dependent oxidoreductase (luciferase family)